MFTAVISVLFKTVFVVLVYSLTYSLLASFFIAIHSSYHINTSWVIKRKADNEVLRQVQLTRRLLRLI